MKICLTGSAGFIMGYLAEELRSLDAPTVLSGNVKLAMSHVLPDLVLKVLQDQDPFHILGSGKQVRHYTYGGTSPAEYA